MNVDGSNPLRLAFRPYSEEIPTDWKGNTILFDSYISQVSDQIWSMDGNGANQIMISGNFDQEGSFSPDMQRITFWRTSDTGANTFVMYASGANAQNITNQIYVRNSAPDWSN